jgi:nucleoside phosphorylase
MFQANEKDGAVMKINLVVALAAEAKPIVNQYKLEREASVKAYALYTSEEMNLVVSGMGTAAAAAATGFLAGTIKSATADLWLNIGVAGHADAEVGEIYLANKVTDSTTGRCFYPPLFLDTMPAATSEVVTVSQPEADFARDALYDMEAYGFFVACTRHSSIEYCQCIKMISDNLATPQDQIEADKIKDLVAKNLTTIDSIIRSYVAALHPYNSVYAIPVELDWLTKQVQFSRSQLVHLATLLHQWQNLDLPKLSQDDEIKKLRTGKQVLAYLEESIKRQVLEF